MSGRPYGKAAEEAFAAADSYYFRSMARVQRLRAVRSQCHADLSAREVETASGAVEHLLHLLRGQRRSIAAAAEAEAALAMATDAVAGLRGVLVDGNFDFNPPPQKATRSWLLRQRALLDRVAAAAGAARLVHKAVSAAESTPSLRPGGAGAAAVLNAAAAAAASARARLDSFLTPTLETQSASYGDDGIAGDNAWEAPPLVNANLRDVLLGNFDAMRSLAGKVEHAFESAATAAAAAATSIEGAAPLPGWEPLRALLAAAVAAADAFESGAPVATITGAGSSLASAAEVDAKIAAAAEVEARIAAGRGLHSSTSQLNLCRLWH